jgi:hypothetical protein
MKRRLLDLLTALSLVLCVAAVAIWVRSYWVWDTFSCRRVGGADVLAEEGGWLAFVNRGQVGAGFTRNVARYPSADGAAAVRAALASRGVGLRWDRRPPAPRPTGPTSTAWQRLGFYGAWSTTPARGPSMRVGNARVRALDMVTTERSVTMPCWLPVALAAAGPGLGLVRVRRRRRAARLRQKHKCPACGYDLRATPDRCPECGTTPAQRSDP